MRRYNNVSTRIRLMYLRSRGSPINLAVILLQTIDNVQEFHQSLIDLIFEIEIT